MILKQRQLSSPGSGEIKLQTLKNSKNISVWCIKLIEIANTMLAELSVRCMKLKETTSAINQLCYFSILTLFSCSKLVLQIQTKNTKHKALNYQTFKLSF